MMLQPQCDMYTVNMGVHDSLADKTFLNTDFVPEAKVRMSSSFV